MIVQALHEIQHEHGYLPEYELRLLAERISQPLHRLHEVASFFPHFRLKKPTTLVDVHVCRDMACHLSGSQRCRAMLQGLDNELGAGNIAVHGVSCLGRCDSSTPAVMINDHVYWDLSESELTTLVRRAAAGEKPTPKRDSREPLGWKIDPDNGKPTYNRLRKIVADWVKCEEAEPAKRRKAISDPILKILEDGKLRGMGGAGFPTFRKWTTVRDTTGDTKYVVVNGDESEPGTFKDRELLRRTPYLLIEGLVIAGIVTGAAKGIIYIRHEYADEIEVTREAVKAATEQGLCGQNILGSDISFPVEVFVSPGGYICGEESALLEAIEDKRAEPRNKPPLPVFEGLYGMPTVVNNVETLSWVPAFLEHDVLDKRAAVKAATAAAKPSEPNQSNKAGDAEKNAAAPAPAASPPPWYARQGVRGATGLRFVSISGDVAKPGVYEVPFGQTVRELVFDTAGGMRAGQKLKAIATSGPSGGFLPAVLEFSQAPVVPGAPKNFVQNLIQRKLAKEGDTSIDILDLPLDGDVLLPFPHFMLGAAFVVYGHECDMVDQALNCVEFYRNESCGKCVPCRMGSQKLVELIRGLKERRFEHDESIFFELSDAMFSASICGLGHVASNPIITVLRYFRGDVEKYLPAARRQKVQS